MGMRVARIAREALDLRQIVGELVDGHLRRGMLPERTGLLAIVENWHVNIYLC